MEQVPTSAVRRERSHLNRIDCGAHFRKLVAVARCLALCLYSLGKRPPFSYAIEQYFVLEVMFVPHIRRQDGALFVLITWAVMLLLWPAQLVAPLATSSVSWVPDTIISSSLPNEIETLIGGAGAGWDTYQIYSQGRMAVVLRAASIASIAQLADSSPEIEAANIATAIRRVIPSCQGLPNGTLVHNVTTPFITFTSFEWVEHPLSLPSEVQDAVTSDDGDQLQISGYWGNPLAIPYPGVAAPLRTVPWASMSNPNPGSQFPYPAGETFVGQNLVAVLVARDLTSILPDAPSNGSFGQLPDIGFLTVNYSNIETNWYAIANISIRAGVAICDGCRLVFPTVVESTNQNQTMLADSLVTEAFNLMPEVIMVMAVMNSSASDPSGRLEDFTKSVVARGYQASWNALNDETGAPARIATQKPRTSVRASVLRSRMYMWAGIHLLLSLSGCLLIFVQGQCVRKPVVDTNIAAIIMMDSSPLLEQDINGLYNAVILGKKDNRLKMLRLRKGVEGSRWSHDVLVNEFKEMQD